ARRLPPREDARRRHPPDEPHPDGEKSVTPDVDAMEAGPEMDALIAARVMNVAPRVEYVISSDGGKSGSYFSASRNEAEHELARFQAAGFSKGASVVEWKHY